MNSMAALTLLFIAASTIVKLASCTLAARAAGTALGQGVRLWRRDEHARRARHRAGERGVCRRHHRRAHVHRAGARIDTDLACHGLWLRRRLISDPATFEFNPTYPVAGRPAE